MVDAVDGIKRTLRGRGRSGLIGVLALAAVVLSACSAATPATTAHVVKGGTVSYALPAGNTPNYIFPLTPTQDASVLNLAYFQPLFYQTLYYYQTGAHIKVDPALSLAEPAKFSVVNGHTVVTITLKNYRWSDGQPITTRDIQFWMNLLDANYANWYAFVPGAFPSNVIKQDYINAHTFSLTFNGVYNNLWLLYNEILQITPIPQQAWDKTSAGQAVGNYDMTPAGARQVFKFLNAQSGQLATYGTNPLWQVVDGPWKISSFSAATGYTTAVASPSFRGPGPIPHLHEIVLQPFTSDTAEFNALRAGTVDYGYVPIQDQSQVGLLRHNGYRIAPETGWATTFMPLNYTNRTGVAPILKQLYVRQALQHLINQPQYIRDIFKGTATACYGPVPCAPASQFLNPLERQPLYAFSPPAAAQLLSSHGWTVRANGTTTCTSPGTGAGHCGTGIAAGAQLSFTLLYDSGYLALQQEMEAFKSTASKVGVQIALRTAPFNTVIGHVDPCNPASGVGCHWEIGNWQNPDAWTYSPYPTGGQILRCGSFANSGNYCSTTGDRLIGATHTASGLTPMFQYQAYMRQQLPDLWLPSPIAQLSAIKTTLHGVVQGPLLYLNTPFWYLTK